jgi:hypothetical protein
VRFDYAHWTWPHFTSVCSYHTPQTSCNIQIKIPINFYDHQERIHDAQCPDGGKKPISFRRECICWAFLGWGEEERLQCDNFKSLHIVYFHSLIKHGLIFWRISSESQKNTVGTMLGAISSTWIVH